jgi:hypothetical protein
MSGLSHTPGKRAWGKTHRGFESRLLRQNSVFNGLQPCQQNPLTPRSPQEPGLFCCLLPVLFDKVVYSYDFLDVKQFVRVFTNWMHLFRLTFAAF